MNIFFLLLVLCCLGFFRILTRTRYDCLCGAIMQDDNRYYNVCVLPLGHEGAHTTAEGVRFYNDR